MTPPTIYELSRGHQDGHVSVLFWHPTRHMAECEWSAHCGTLLEEAARRAVEKEAAREHPSWVGMGEIMDEMIPMLEAAGFVRLTTVRRDYYDAIIIRAPGDGDDPDGPDDCRLPRAVVELANAHNLKIERREWEEAGRIWDEPT
jgi:hypothetical protein